MPSFPSSPINQLVGSGCSEDNLIPGNNLNVSSSKLTESLKSRKLLRWSLLLRVSVLFHTPQSSTTWSSWMALGESDFRMSKCPTWSLCLNIDCKAQMMHFLRIASRLAVHPLWVAKEENSRCTSPRSVPWGIFATRSCMHWDCTTSTPARIGTTTSPSSGTTSRKVRKWEILHFKKSQVWRWVSVFCLKVKKITST